MPYTAPLFNGGEQSARLHATEGTCLSIWRNRYALTCVSVTNSVEHQFSGQTGFGKTMSANIIRQGDLIKSVTAVFALPGLAPADKDEWAHWSNNLAYTLAQEIQWDIGGTLASRTYGDALRIQHELIVPPHRRADEAAGTAFDQQTLVGWAQDPRRLYYLPLSCWVDWHTGNALPICAMMQQTVSIKILTCQHQDAWVSGPVGAHPLAITAQKGTYQPLTPQTLDAFLLVDWVTLDDRERDSYQDQQLTYLMYQVQKQETCVSCTSQSGMLQPVKFSFQHPVFALAWYVADTQKKQFNRWDWSGAKGTDPIVVAQIKSNSDELMSSRDAKYFRHVHPAQKGLNVPNMFVYLWSFATHPFQHQPSGSLNMTRTPEMQIAVRFQPEARESIVTILAWNYNWLIVENQYARADYAGC